MTHLDRELLAEKTAALHRHLDRIAERLPPRAEDLQSGSDAADVVVLHLWQAVQVAIDVAVAACLHLKLGTPPTYAEAFRRLADAGHLDPDLASRLVRAAGFRNLVAHAYGRLDMTRVHHAALAGPADLKAFVAALRMHV